MSQSEAPFSLCAYPTKVSKEQCDFFYCASKMVTIHNGLLRPLNAIYQQAPYIKPADVPSFLLYCEAWSHSLHHHHGIEETIFFPDVERVTGVKGIMDGNIQQHQLFESGLERYDEYIKSQQKSPSAFDGKDLRRVIDSFGNILRQHLQDEIPTLLALKQYQDKLDIAQMFRDIDAKIMKESSLADAAYVATAGAAELLEGAPAPIRVLIGLIGTWKRWTGFFKFAPCTGFGVPIELYAKPIA